MTMQDKVYRDMGCRRSHVVAMSEPEGPRFGQFPSSLLVIHMTASDIIDTRQDVFLFLGRKA
jgi:hypothetical protein